MENLNLFNRAKKLKSEGYDYGKIRKYLSNEGAKNIEITEIFRIIDEEGISELRLKQKVSQAKTQYYIAFVIFIISLVYNFLEYKESFSIHPATIIFPIILVLGAYFHLKSLKNKRHSMTSLLREEKRNSNKKYTFR
mgnify:CR=1 FL=1